jgi:GWxTD domain-containing protein
MSQRLSTLILCLSLAAAGLSAGGRTASGAPGPQAEPRAKPVEVTSLDPIYQDFLKLTTYIISPKEKEVFLKLSDDRDRNIFIDSFWKLRDPTPGTPENEYKDEIIRRFNYVNKRFAVGRPGWMTDRGRFYMILGEPSSYDRYPGTLGVNPTEVWYYYTDGSKGLPTHFGLVFYMKSGFGDYRLYDPFVDGPKALIQNMASVINLDPDDYEGVYEKLREMAPALADMSISLIPGEFGFGYQPTSRSTELIADVLKSPQVNLNPSYATHFFDYKGMVSTEYLTNYVESQGLAVVIQDPILDLPFVHFSVSPTTLTSEYYAAKDQFYCDVKLDVSLRKGDTVIYQNSKEFPLYFRPEEIDRVRANGIAFEDSFPVPEGDYRLTVLLQNTVGKEFTVFERPVSVPAAGSAPALDGPFLGYKVESYQTGVQIPFKTVDRKLDVDPKMSFGTADDVAVLFNVTGLTQELWQNGEARLEIKGLGQTPMVKNISVRLANSPYSRVLNIVQVVPGSTLTPDYYRATVSLLGSDKTVLDEKSAEFVVAATRAIAHPIARAKGFSLANQFYFYYQLAGQYAKLGLDDQAEANYARGFGQNPGYKEGVLEYARFLVGARKYDRALEIIENLKDFQPGRFEYFLVKGLATMGRGDYPQAIRLLQEANKVYNSDTVLLNALGACYLKTGQKAQALEAYRASLKLNAKQEDVQKIIVELEKSR